MNKNISFKGVCAALAAVLLAAAVSAPVRAEERDWTGPRVGVSVGAGMSAGHAKDPDCNYCADTTFSDRLIQAGVSGGYDKQFGSAVLGLGAEVNVGSQRHAETLEQVNTGGSRQYFLSKINWTGALLARAGVAAERTMFYLTAGPAIAHFEGSLVDGQPAGYRAAFNGWQPALKAGVGLEYMMGRHATIQAQYSTLTVADRYVVAGLNKHVSFANSQSVATLGAGWRF